ncbi:sugar phosphate isomerase/epimerase family protein [Nocardioides iriomotensis]|uniref:Sugar phosphate isomerase/epimerase n=1 Tax=Nocardioides iriomotensis TaxID=715784 RepID=A0A4Q5IXG2_9ACTN|nr:TIM barrel protein [Nocardioides iriomotensis]RYU09651.1 sugar phosphate isomerase/epimerase [Nocardioides iriomotensis]
MRISISNIAWSPADDDAVAEILRAYGVDAVDVAPAKYVPDVLTASDADLLDVRRAWEVRGFEITGMQSLLFGTSGFNVFGPEDVRERMLDYLGAVCRVGSALGARQLVFGSPRNRDRAGLDDDTVLDVSTGFFHALGDRAAAHGVVVDLEPNPTKYGANFMTTSAETAEVVRRVQHPAIRMQLDLGACTMNGEDVAEVVPAVSDIVGHVHLSEPGLAPVGDGSGDHEWAARVLQQHLPGHVACIEMLMTEEEPAVAAVERAVAFVTQRYGQGAS